MKYLIVAILPAASPTPHINISLNSDGFFDWCRRKLPKRYIIYDLQNHRINLRSQLGDGRNIDLPSSIFLISYLRLSYRLRRVSFFRLSWKQRRECVGGLDSVCKMYHGETGEYVLDED